MTVQGDECRRGVIHPLVLFFEDHCREKSRSGYPTSIRSGALGAVKGRFAGVMEDAKRFLVGAAFLGFRHRIPETDPAR
jgi:hypothetical protein